MCVASLSLATDLVGGGVSENWWGGGGGEKGWVFWG